MQYKIVNVFYIVQVYIVTLTGCHAALQCVLLTNADDCITIQKRLDADRCAGKIV